MNSARSSLSGLKNRSVGSQGSPGKGGATQVYVTDSAEETIALGERLGRLLPPETVVCLSGDLAAGKTTLTKGIVSGATGCHSDDVSSPTFVYLAVYEGRCPVYHFDLYRLRDSDEFLAMGFEEYFTQGGICCIEWSERIAPLIPDNAVRVHLEHYGAGQRRLTVQSHEKEYRL